jgi:hypothetical protein
MHHVVGVCIRREKKKKSKEEGGEDAAEGAEGAAGNSGPEEQEEESDDEVRNCISRGLQQLKQCILNWQSRMNATGSVSLRVMTG